MKRFLKSKVLSQKSKVLSQKSEVWNESISAMNHGPSTMNYRLWTMVYGLVPLLFTQNAFSQALSISYTSPQTYTVGTAITPLAPTITGDGPYANGQTTTLAGSTTAGYVNATGTSARFNEPGGIVVDASGNVYVGDVANYRIRKITPGGVVTTFAGSGTAGAANGIGTAASFNGPYGLAIDASGNIYVADKANNLIRKITPGGVVTTFAGSGAAGYADGTGTAAIFSSPSGIAIDAQGNLYIGDTLNDRIRKISPFGVVTTLAGSGAQGSGNGTGTLAQFNRPYGVTVDPAGNVYVADWYNHLIRAITPGGVVTTLSGNGTAGWVDGGSTYAEFNYPAGITIDAAGNLYVADEYNNRIRKVTSNGGYATTLAGSGTAGSANGTGGTVGSATFNHPVAVAIDSTGFVYVTDFENNMIRKVDYGTFTIAPTLPAGLSFNAASGTISGIPLVPSAATNYTITAYDGNNATATVNITVNAAPAGGQGQSLNENYVLTNAPRIAGITSDSTLTTVYGIAQKLQTSIQYVDGLGRPVQTVQAQASPLGYDMIAPQAYDQYDREVTKYLPYTPQAGTTGSYRINAVSTDQNAFYAAPPSGSNVTAITDPFAQTNFDNSPLNRTVEQGAPGVPWQLSTTGIPGSGHTVKMVYTLNNSTSFTTDSINGRQVAMYYTVINSDNSQTLVANGYYPASTLTVTISEDENWTSTGGRAGTVEEYKDIDGHVVLKRVYNFAGGVVQVLSTYYVYDDLGRLAFVLPPGLNADTPTTYTLTQLNNLAYMYQYDLRGRPVEKLLPGKLWEYTVYNNMDQPVATQDGNQRANNQWIFTKYDAQQRPVMTIIWNDGGTAISRAALQGVINGFTTNLYESSITTGNGYTNVVWPTTNITETLSVNYYDNYTNMPGLPAAYTAPTGANMATRGEVTGTLTAVLNTPTNMLWTAHYYDYWGRSLKSYMQHYLGGTLSNNNYDAISTTYNFTNAPTTTTRQHWNTASTINPLVTIANTYIYDNVGRKLKSWEQITNGTTATTKTLLSQVSYNEIGQLYEKQLQSTDSVTFQQAIAYTYNERGWLLTSSAPLFAMALYYNTGTNKQYNGNIAYQYWGVPGNLNNNYTYTYDKLNRLTSGVTALDNYKETGITYDLMGNITALNRYQAGTEIDQLAYTYTSGGNATNQLQNVVDANASNSGLVSGTTAYTYDGNGNMLSSTNTTNTAQNKSFTYNLLNLPLVATFAAGTATYTYDATGNKLRKVDLKSGTTTTTDYISGIEYDNSTTTIGFIQTEEGKAVPITGGYDYTYYLGDNLGNTRITFDTKTGSAVTLQQDDYYPFGLEINRLTNSPKNEYLYNKKELQEETQTYDYGARFYDPVIARWTSVDPKAEKSRRWSPYNYVENDPIRLTDPDGMEAEWLKGKNAKVNGGKATYTVNKDGTLKWTNATKATKELGNNLAAHGGEKDLKAAVDSKHEIDLNHSAGKGPGDRLGQTATFPDKAGSTTAAKSEVTIYQGSIDAQQSRLANEQSWEPNQIKTYEDEKSALYQALSQLGDADAALAGVTDHELFHATDQQNIHDSLSNSSNDVEVGPTTRENGILKAAVVKDVMNIVKSFIP